MDDTLAEDRSLALALAALLDEHSGGGVTALDMSGLNSWTGFFVIATATSGTHLSGLERHVKEYCHEHNVGIMHRSRKTVLGGNSAAGAVPDDWRLIDLGMVVVHLMSERARSFYELERLWSEAPVIYSSKSS